MERVALDKRVRQNLFQILQLNKIIREKRISEEERGESKYGGSKVRIIEANRVALVVDTDLVENLNKNFKIYLEERKSMN